MIVFSDPWARAWCAALNHSEEYRAAAATWEGSVGAVAAGGNHLPSAVFLDLHHGRCRAASAATDADLAGADFVIEGTGAAWRDLLTGRQAPLMALMTGRIRLSRGELSQLLPHASSAKTLVALAAQIEAAFPADW